MNVSVNSFAPFIFLLRPYLLIGSEKERRKERKERESVIVYKFF